MINGIWNFVNDITKLSHSHSDFWIEIVSISPPPYKRAVQTDFGVGGGGGRVVEAIKYEIETMFIQKSE